MSPIVLCFCLLSQVPAEPNDRLQFFKNKLPEYALFRQQSPDAPLTLKQLDIIKEEFSRVLIGMYHNRIDYPTSSGGVTSEFASV